VWNCCGWPSEWIGRSLVRDGGGVCDSVKRGLRRKAERLGMGKDEGRRGRGCGQ
jgi:hypothetical protein